MERQEIMRILAEYFELELDEEEELDIEDYDWQAGCYIGKKWFCLAEVVKCIEQNF